MPPTPDLPPPPPDWDAFYRYLLKPGYLPGFEINTKLGGGTIWLVFRARRLSIGKDYAIKFLHVEDGAVRAAIARELEQVPWFAQIDHPNLVAIEDRGEVDGIPYLVMAFAGTETLRDRLVAGQVPTGDAKDELLRIFLQCCRGAAALHERSLVHFDIKPANVFLKGSVARLGDYGLSKLVTQSRGSLSMGRGTPYYMAPELLQRRGDHRSDVYSLGVMLYELLCGALPFRGDSEWEVLRQHETATPVWPAHLTAKEQAILARCLQKDPAARFPSVLDLIAACGNGSVARPAAAMPPMGAADGVMPGCVPPHTGQPKPAGAGSKPAGAPSDKDAAKAGLARASREVVQHAGVLARDAIEQAARVTRDAATQASEALRRAFAPASDAQAAERAAKAAARAERRRRQQRRGVLVIAVVLVGVFLLRTVVRSSPRPSWTSNTSMPALEHLAGQMEAFASSWSDVQRELLESHPTSWVTLAARDPEQAHGLLLARIERLRAQVPFAPEQRVKVTDWPAFVDTLPVGETERLQPQIARLAANVDYDENLAERLAARAPASLVLASRLLQQVAWDTPDAQRAGANLHRFLVETTGCRDLELADPDTCEPAAARLQNRPLGNLWRWFVDEFARDDQTWRAYRELLDR
ncbi:MAG: serine/threonine protein kinase [Planctomycetes bacterium]|nr:serine/threonine protein kinase [Planctomycetota bacterium]